MKVFLTGSEGKIGSVVTRVLRDDGHEVVGFDLALGHDILNPSQVKKAMQGCEGVVHLAAHLGDEGKGGDIMAVNLIGTWNVLSAAAKVGVKRVVFSSSVEVFGIFRGERAPDYLPLDELHSCYPKLPYALSKRLAEEMCQLWSASTGISSVCLRLPGVFGAEDYEYIIDSRRSNPEFEWSPFWQYGAFLDVRDAAEAITRALFCALSGSEILLLCAEDVSSASLTSRELVQKLLPAVEWRGGSEYDKQPFKALLNTERAQRILDWKPRTKWRGGEGVIQGVAAS